MDAGIAHLRFGVLANNGGALLQGRAEIVDHTIHDAISALPFLIAGTDDSHLDLADVIATNDTDMFEINDSLEIAPLACTSLALLMRGAEARSVEEGLIAESATYSLLQAGPEFAAWRETNPPKAVWLESSDPIVVAIDENQTTITFNRPHKHNAFSTQMQSQLVDALAATTANKEMRIRIIGKGPSFCSGGDLDEFGTRPDVATAHITRLTRSAGRLLAQLSDRTEFHIHGACMGAGIELPAFASRITAHPDTLISLPEIRLGLIPGAGGTASLPRRIGRHRTTLLGLTARTISAQTALDWGLIDAISAV